MSRHLTLGNLNFHLLAPTFSIFCSRKIEHPLKYPWQEIQKFHSRLIVNQLQTVFKTTVLLTVILLGIIKSLEMEK
jgi:hypothetical protein